ncbi:MAG TPA: hypothetical protein VNE39_03870 [Planctomycetota bacterium]|nr:hypothetical protein [Planctomycetota bacterium]
MRGILLALFASALAAGGARAQGWESTLSRTHPYDIPTPLADDPSPFVHVPARVGFYTGMFTGLLPGVMIGMPIGLLERATQGHASQFTADLMQLPAMYAGVGMHYVAGGPFYLTKLVMWDLPRGILGVDKRGSRGTGVLHGPAP